MAVAVGLDKVAHSTIMQENQQNVRNMVLDSYQDMLDGKGRDYKEFFAEIEGRYMDADL